MRLRTAVVGTGAMALKHCRILSVHPRTVLKLICSTPRSRDVADEFRKDFGFQRTCADFDGVVQADDVDAVVICSPDHTHADFVVRALRADKHVLCEKPLARSMEEFDAVARALASSRGVLQVGMNCRYRAPYFRPFKLGQSLGSLRFLRGTYLLNKISTVREGRKPWWAESADRSHFFLHANGVHIVDLMRWFGGPVKSVFARSACLEMKEGFKADTFSVSLSFASGALGELLISLCALQPREVELQAWYEKGTIRGNRFYRRVGDEIAPEVEELEFDQPLLDLHLQFDDFFQASSGSSSPMNNLEEARANFLLLEALDRSLESGTPIEVAGVVGAT